ncbi:MAG: hypothetical protein KDI75_08395 [Xanthomonadales bacterium]|nr:hypothetical protein [Xanthomonadales bacterium]
MSAAPASRHAESLKSQWKAYLHQQIAPDFDWLNYEPAAMPSLIAPLRNQFASSLRGEQHFQVALADTGSVWHLRLAPRDQVRHLATGSELGLLGDARSMLKGEFVASSIEQSLGENGRLALGAVLARQRFASAGLGVFAWDAPVRLYGSHVDPLPESATGGGVRLDYSRGVASGLSLSVGVQSRINMEPFKAYRGVYSEPGDFDVPARAEVALSYQPNQHWQLSAGAERIFYSGIDAFSSAALPRRFLSLLGDGASPTFAWRDLSIYSAEAALDDQHGGKWSLRYTTQQQPEPTSEILLRALRSDFTDSNWALGYRRGLGSFGTLSLAASYAPSRYFLGATPYVQRDLDSGSQVEVEAVWSMSF